MLVLLGCAGGGCLLFLLLWGRISESRWQDWETLLNNNDQALYAKMRSQLDGELAMADYAYDKAEEHRLVGSVDEAIRLVELGYAMIERAAPDLRRLLNGMAVFSRMVSAMVPVAPLRPRDFKVTELASLAALNQILHRFLVTSAERFRLRLYVLGQGLGVVLRFLAGSTRRIRDTRSTVDRDWNDLNALRSDFRTITDESLESFRVCLASLAAQSRRLSSGAEQSRLG
ncbi:MAG TPA: hypothetical protein VMT87_02110 [Vicinamibacteria bacterium]|nr:hypothetical protein [Vicinamibacteria bacterium]